MFALPVRADEQGQTAMWNSLGYFWIAARGYRFHPWDSPYLRWRMETFLGNEAQNLTASKFMKILWKYRQNMQNFVDWAAERRRVQAKLRSAR
jgi:hypothetical protein